MYDVGHTWHLLQCLTQFQCFNVCAVSVCIQLDVGVHAAPFCRGCVISGAEHYMRFTDTSKKCLYVFQVKV